MQNFYGNAALELPCRAVLRNTQGARKGGAITVDSTVVDTGNGLARTTLIRQGLLVVKVTSTGRYIRADTNGGDRSAPPAVTASETADADWASKTITLKRNGATVVVVTLGAGDDTDAEVRDALNANAIFAANAVASVASSRVVVTGLVGGAGESIEVVSNLATAFGTYGTSDAGEDADYRVLGDDGGLPGDMFDPAGAVANQTFANWIAGDFDSSKLIGTTGDALAVLARRGSTIL